MPQENQKASHFFYFNENVIEKDTASPINLLTLWIRDLQSAQSKLRFRNTKIFFSFTIR